MYCQCVNSFLIVEHMFESDLSREELSFVRFICLAVSVWNVKYILCLLSARSYGMHKYSTYVAWAIICEIFHVRVFGGGVYQANARFPLTCQGERDTSRPFRLLLPLSMSSSLLGDFWCDPLSSIVTGYPARAARLVLELCGSEGKQSAVSAVHTVGVALLGVGPNTLAGLCMGWG
jgi:hypothetical protein